MVAQNYRLATPARRFINLFILLAGVIIAIIFQTSSSFAFDNYAECKILDQKIEQQFASLSLDEPFLRKDKRFGFYQTTYDDGAVELVKIHPDLSDELYEKYNEANLNNTFVEKVNGVPIKEVNEELWDEFDSNDSITFEMEGYSDKFVISKKDYSSLIIDDFILSVDDISAIDTKTSSFHTKFTTVVTWRDERLISILKAINAGAPDPNASGFFCKIDLEKWAQQNLFIPSVQIDNFETKLDEKRQQLFVHFDNSPEGYCETYFDCSLIESNEGVAFYELRSDYVGRISDQFYMQKFPFDEQYLRFTFLSDSQANQYYELDINTTEYSDRFLETAVYELHRPEWEFDSFYSSYGWTLDRFTEQYVQTLQIDFEVHRKSSYFIYKLVLPITFLIALSWMVFFINIDELESRLTISVVCFLSLIAYNFVVDDSLPKLGYLTFIDIFILISYLFSGIPTIQTVVAEWHSRKSGISLSDTLDGFFRQFYFASYIFAVILSIIYFEIFDWSSLL